MEVRAARTIYGIDLEGFDEDGRDFLHHLHDCFRKNSHDWHDYHLSLGINVTEEDRLRACDAAFGQGAPPDYEALPGGDLSAYTEDLWDESRKLALAMLSAEDEIDIGYNQLPLERVSPSLWRRRGWTPTA